MRRAARKDGNQDATVEALAKIGARAIYIRKPVDLLVGYRGITLLLELKDLDAERGPTEAAKLTEEERAFIDTWPGQVAVVFGPEDAVRVVVDAARPAGVGESRA